MLIVNTFPYRTNMMRIQVSIEKSEDFMSLRNTFSANSHIFDIREVSQSSSTDKMIPFSQLNEPTDLAEGSSQKHEFAVPRRFGTQVNTVSMSQPVNTVPMSQPVSTFAFSQVDSESLDPLSYDQVSSSQPFSTELRTFQHPQAHALSSFTEDPFTLETSSPNIKEVVSKEIQRQLGGLTQPHREEKHGFDSVLSGSDQDMKQLYLECMRDPTFPIFVCLILQWFPL